MNETMRNITDAVRSAMMTRGDGKEFHRTIPSHGYEVERDVASVPGSYRYPGEAGTVKVYYHGTCVASIAPDNRVTLDNGGWYTITTKNVMNAALMSVGLDAFVYQERGTWKVGVSRGEDATAYRYENGMTVCHDSPPSYKPDAHRCVYTRRH